MRERENDSQRKTRPSREWKRFGLAWLFWGVAGFAINAIPFWSHEQLNVCAEFAAILASGTMLYVIVGFYEDRDVVENVLGTFGLTWGNPVLAFCVLAAGFSLGHFCVRNPAVLHTEFADRMFLIHGGVVAAFVLFRILARRARGFFRWAQICRMAGNVTGALAICAAIANIVFR